MEIKLEHLKDAETAAAKNRWHTGDCHGAFCQRSGKCLRDAGGKVVGGAEGKVEEITDLWDLRRDTKIDGSELDTG